MVVVLRTAWRFAGAFMESVTVPVKPLRAFTPMREVPVRDGKKSKAADCHAGTRGPIEVREAVTAKSMLDITVTGTVVVLDNVMGAVPVVPVIVRVNGFGVVRAVQLTVNTVPETLAVQPVGAALVENATVPAKPLIAANDSAEV
jgi:hypothetical protein